MFFMGRLMGCQEIPAILVPSSAKRSHHSDESESAFRQIDG